MLATSYASCAHRLHLLEDSATPLLLVSCTHWGSGQGGTATFLLRFVRCWSCTAILRITPMARKPGRIVLLHGYLRGLCDDSAPRLRSAGAPGPALVVHHATASLVEPIRWRSQATNPGHQAQAQVLPRAQTLCGPDAQASLCVV